MLAAATIIFSRLGLIAGVITLVVVVGALVGLARSLRGTGRKLDELVDATRRVEAGDYTVRVDVPERGLRSVRELTQGFDTMVERLQVDEDQRRTLLADVSHELRTPLTVISGNLEAMLDGVHPLDAAHLAPILDEAQVMSRLIDDLRTLALSEAGTLALHPEPVDPDVLISEVVASFAAPAGTAGVTVTAEVADDLPLVEVDPVRIREILTNLVANGLRHTPAGGRVTVRATIEADALVVRVSDTGPGIDPSLIPFVFERFTKGSGSSGSGLGLAIARHLTEAHGGTLEVESTGSAGTTFRATLAIRQVDGPTDA
jgi:signal transduction histidine kinase